MAINLTLRTLTADEVAKLTKTAQTKTPGVRAQAKAELDNLINSLRFDEPMALDIGDDKPLNVKIRLNVAAKRNNVGLILKSHRGLKGTLVVTKKALTDMPAKVARPNNFKKATAESKPAAKTTKTRNKKNA